MKNVLNDFDKAFENRVRLGVMSALVVNDFVYFNTLKELLSVTDGNLASHLKSLEKINYIIYEKKFLERKANTSYSATELGRKAFIKHLRSIEQVIKQL